MKVFTVYDCKAEAYLNPFYSDATGQAKRIFTDAVNDKQHPFGQHPEDYTLFELGSYDSKTAQFTNLDAPLNLGVGITFTQEG